MGHSRSKEQQRQLCAAGYRLAKSRRSKGFSLIEALIAVLIAAILAAVLTQLASTTRMNADRIQELMSMMTLNGALLAQVAPKELGTTNGRTGKFSWRVVVAPLDYSATARRTNDKPEENTTNSRKLLGLAALTDVPGPIKKTDSVDTAKWLPVHVTVAVDSPSGRSYRVDTISNIQQPKQNDRP